MENYGNSAVKVLGMFHVFLKWKDNVYRQLFYVTNCDKSLNLLSHDACYTLGVLKPCYTVEKALPVSRTSTDSTNPTKCQATPSKVGNSFLHHEMKGTVNKLSDNSTKHSISKQQLQGSPLTKQVIGCYLYNLCCGEFGCIYYRQVCLPIGFAWLCERW